MEASLAERGGVAYGYLEATLKLVVGVIIIIIIMVIKPLFTIY